MFGKLTHLAFDALLIAGFLAGIRRTTGLTCVLPSSALVVLVLSYLLRPALAKVPNKDIRRTCLLCTLCSTAYLSSCHRNTPVLSRIRRVRVRLCGRRHGRTSFIPDFVLFAERVTEVTFVRTRPRRSIDGSSFSGFIICMRTCFSCMPILTSSSTDSSHDACIHHTIGLHCNI